MKRRWILDAMENVTTKFTFVCVWVRAGWWYVGVGLWVCLMRFVWKLLGVKMGVLGRSWGVFGGVGGWVSFGQLAY